jgi:uncharacterized protein (DUF58 family)
MASLLIKVKAKMAIHAHEKVRGMLEGEYGSVFKGRSMDFDDLREYIPGDDIKDIDWKATARSGSTLIRRYIAIRKHNIMLVVDTGRNMAATSAAGDNKRDVSVMVAGVIGYIALKHGDLVGLISGDTTRSYHLPLKGDTPSLERVLQHIHTTTDLSAPDGNIGSQLEYIARSIRRRMMLIIVADDSVLTPEHITILRRLRAQHEILWINIGDASGLETGHEYYDIDARTFLADSLRKKSIVTQAFAEQEQQMQLYNTKQLQRLGIVSQRITGDADVVSGLFRLLERRRHAKQR